MTMDHHEQDEEREAIQAEGQIRVESHWSDGDSWAYRSWEIAPENIDWTPLDPLDDLDSLESFPVDSLPSPLSDWVVAESEATQTPPELAALTALSALSTVAHPDLEIQVKPGWREPMALWSVVTMASGERKSAVMSDATRPISDLEKVANESIAAQVRAHDTAERILQARLKRAETAAAKENGKLQEAQEIAVELGEFRERRPVFKRHFTDDSTPEALAHLMADQGGKNAIFSAEGGIFGMLAGRYSDCPNLDVYLKGHAGETIRVDRRNAEPLTIDRAVLSMGLAVQPIILEGLASNLEFRGTGFLARFLYALPKSTVGCRAIDPAPVPQALSDSYAELFRRVSDHGPTVLEFDRGALAEMDRIRTELEPRLGEYGDLHQVADWASKLPGAIARIAGIFALVGGNSVICVNCVLRGKILIPFLLSHCLGAFGLMGADPVKGKAKRLLKWVQRGGMAEFSKRDAHKGNRATFKKVKDLDGPLAMLKDHGFIRSKPGSGSRGKGRPASPVFLVNPLLLAQKSQKSQKSPVQ